MTWELTRAAERDIADILTTTFKVFGTVQLSVYADIIDKDLAMVGDDPERGGSIDRFQIAPGVKLFHLELAAGRSGGAAHCIYHIAGRLSNGRMGTIILRILHESMGPRRRVVGSLNSRSFGS